MSNGHQGHIVAQDSKGNFCLTCRESFTDAIEIVDSRPTDEIPGIVGTAGGREETEEKARWGKKRASKEKEPD